MCFLARKPSPTSSVSSCERPFIFWSAAIFRPRSAVRRGRARAADCVGFSMEVSCESIHIKRFLGTVSGRLRPLLITATFTGLRASELRGLRWQDVDLHRSELHVHQR